MSVGGETIRPDERPPLSMGCCSAPRTATSRWSTLLRVTQSTTSTCASASPSPRPPQRAPGPDHRRHRRVRPAAAGHRIVRPHDRGVRPGAAFTLRTYADSDRLSDAVREGSSLVIAGAGWVGREVAAAGARGATVMVVESAALPLQRVLGDEMAEVFADLHRARGGVPPSASR
ncbi:FAD-dependent oxidoreductase [Micromonosporaceae bacterium Da 78-11]